MNYLGTIDYVIMAVYFALLVALGLYLRKKASASIEDYFIGGRQIPWWALGMSGMASYLDIAGTMLIVSFLFLIGPEGIFIAFRGGAVLVLPFMLLWVGKWHRRSGCITGAEWMIFRFGDGPGGRFAQIVSVLAGVMGTVGMLAYLVVAVGSFLSMFLPFEPATCALLLIGGATIYTMVSGFYGVVYTDMFQSVFILIAAVAITLMAVFAVDDAASLAAVAGEVTGSQNWSGSLPSYKNEMPEGYKQYEFLILIAFFYLLRNVFYGMGSGQDPKYFGARNDRECGTLTFLWTWMMTIRWPMMMGFAVLGIYLVKDLFPDQSVLAQAADLIKQHYPDIEKNEWGATLANIIKEAKTGPTELTEGLKALLTGDDWTRKLQMVSWYGTVNPEKILPAVLLFKVQTGFRGLLLVALIAASMSTFDSNVNATTGLFTRDIYQKYLRPKASTSELIYASWAFICLMVGMGFLFAYSFDNIQAIWGWIIMGLGGGLVGPIFLRFYWWRFNGGGFAIGTAVGMVGAVVQNQFWPDANDVWKFVGVASVGLVGTIVGTYLTAPTDRKVLENFYRKTRPFGLWKPLEGVLSEEELRRTKREHRNDLMAVPFNLLWQVSLFMWPMQLIIKAYTSFYWTFGFFLVGLLGMYFIWYKNLPATNWEEEETEKDEG